MTYFKKGKKEFAWLLDPDKVSIENLDVQMLPDYFFIGGSFITSNKLESLCLELKSRFSKPLVLFPGDPSHLNEKADAVLLLSLLSGRNAEYLIGKHVVAAPFLKRSGLDILATAYLLIDAGKATSASYMSGSLGIPYNKPEIAAATAMAAEFLGMSYIFLDTGSGADAVCSNEMIAAVRASVDLPIIVGGGIRTPKMLENVYLAGADVAVIGNVLEKEPCLLPDFVAVKYSFS